MIPGQAQQFFEAAAAQSGAEAGYTIERGLRFNDDDGAKLTRTFSAGNQSKWTWSGWVKRSSLGTKHHLFAIHTANNNSGYFRLAFNSDSTLFVGLWSNSVLTSAAVYRDLSAWMHIVLALDLGNSTAADKIILYVNGVRQSVTLNVGSETSYAINSAALHNIGSQTSTSQHFDGYLAEVNFVDGSALDPTDFGEYDDNNVWQPKDTSGLTFGTNGFRLKFDDNSSNAALGNDSSGNDNDWTVNNLTAGGPSVSTTGNISLGSATRNFYFKGASGQSIGVSLGNHIWDSSDGISWTYRGTSSTSVSLTNTYVFLSGTTGITFTNSSSASVKYWDLALNTGIANGTGTTATFPVEAYGTENIDSLIDTPTNYTAASGNNGGNYATLNPLAKGAAHTLSNGNLSFTMPIAGGSKTTPATIGVSSGKYYWEMNVTAVATYYPGIGIDSNPDPTGQSGDTATGRMYLQNGQKFSNATLTNYGANYAAGDVIAAALDMDGGTITFYKNGVSQGQAFSGITGTQFPVLVGHNGAAGSFNYGQRPFAYTPPTGYVSLCTQNLPDPTIADGSTAMSATTWTGNGSTQTVSGLNHSPDFIWHKIRSISGGSQLYDSVRGTSKRLRSDSTAAESTLNGVTAFNSDGWTMTAGNNNNESYVSWTWDAGTSTVSNTDGSITSNVRANASAGFSIVTASPTTAYTNYTIGHGLNATPEFIFGKNRAQASQWDVYHQDVGTGKLFRLNQTSAVSTATANQDSYYPTAPTNSVFGFVANGATNNYVWYCFAPVEGFSAFGGPYSGTGSASTAAFQYCGFKPRLLMIRRTDSSTSGNWIMLDSARSPVNVINDPLYANSNAAEYADKHDIVDFLSNGFRIRAANNDGNNSGGSFIWAAWAESPFKTSRAH